MRVRLLTLPRRRCNTLHPASRESQLAHPLNSLLFKQNLRNVAVPGTGVPLSCFCWAKPLAYLLIFGLYPLLAFVGALSVGKQEFEDSRSVRKAYAALCAANKEFLLAPEDWCVFLCVGVVPCCKRAGLSY